MSCLTVEVGWFPWGFGPHCPPCYSTLLGVIGQAISGTHLPAGKLDLRLPGRRCFYPHEIPTNRKVRMPPSSASPDKGTYRLANLSDLKTPATDTFRCHWRVANMSRATRDVTFQADRSRMHRNPGAFARCAALPTTFRGSAGT